MCIKYLTNVFTAFLNLIKMSSCSRNSPLKEMLYLQFIHLYLNRNMQVLTPSY